ncbi:preprotein translocase subunit SecF [Haloechinothrix alba]|uniref:Protein-export membrane protein SecF n=2 Tax=Haloechinothrix alba TaxID=664784 RepID=A0A238WZG1_9PSEU|nr:preprotein translocase subunit SecF [Haloechinothrix alba]
MSESSTTEDEAKPAGGAAGRKRHGKMAQIYLGTGGFEFIETRKYWYIIGAAVMLACIATIVFRGFTPGIEFVGGTQMQMPAEGAAGEIDPDEAGEVVSEAIGVEPSVTQLVGSGDAASVQLRMETLTVSETDQVKSALFDEFQPVGVDGSPSEVAISDSAVSASWGGEITQKALIALVVFLVLVSVFIALYFEKWMAVAALVALAVDLTVTAGVYSMVGFEVTPATVIGLLTILGYSLYDTVVVFDKVNENTRGLLNLSRQTYGEAANLANNQTLMRSINTSLTSLLPVLGLLLIGAGLLGAGTLKDLALVQAIGITVGTASSIYIAVPVLVDLKMRDQEYRDQAARVYSRRGLARRGAGSQGDEAPDTGDDEVLSSEVRKEKAYAAAASVPARTPKRSKSGASPSAKPAGKSSGTPTGKSSGKSAGRPSGKRGR